MPFNAMLYKTRISNEIKPEDLEPPDKNNLDHAKLLKHELDESNLNLDTANPDEIKNTMPLYYAELEICAEESDQTVPDYIADADLYEDIRMIKQWCEQQCQSADNYVLALQAIKLLQSKAALAIDHQAINDYHIRLDNQLYKALKALREAQSWRLETLEVKPA